MNKTIFDKIIRERPGEDYLLFINDDVTLCGQIIAAGRKAVFIGRDRFTDQYFTSESFRAYMEGCANTGTYMCSYTYVLACYRKGLNQELKEILFRIGGLMVREDGWRLFSGREYLSLPERQKELEEVLGQYVRRVIGPDRTDSLKCQFHLNGQVWEPQKSSG